MSWLAWRQQRFVLLGWSALVLVFVGVLLAYRWNLAEYIDQHHLAACAQGWTVPGCPSASPSKAVGFPMARAQLASDYASLDYLAVALAALPLVGGVFVAAPLFATELESSTHRLVLTQSVSRSRWALTKLAVAAGPVLAGVALLDLLYLDWATSLGHLLPVSNVFLLPSYDIQGLVPLGYTLLALAVGALAGLLTRRTLPAMLSTGAVLLGVGFSRLLFRPLLATPASFEESLNHPAGTPRPASPIGDHDWMVESGYLDAAGARIPHATVVEASRACDTVASTGYEQCLSGRLGAATHYIDYHSADHYWFFQTVETGLHVVLALGVVAVALWWVRNRLR